MNHPTHIQSVSLEEVAQTYGLPLYVYDGDKILHQIQSIQRAFSDVPLRIKYATKALSNISILKVVKKAGAGVDAVSVEEVRLCLLAGFAPEEIMYTPSGVSFAEIEEAVSLGVMINLDSLPLMEEFGKRFGSTIPVCLRINPHILAGGHSKISVGHRDSKFGISIELLSEIVGSVSRHSLQIVGLHLHTGSDILDAEIFLRGAGVLFEAAAEFPNLRFLDFGGGFKVAYKEGDPATEMAEVGRIVSEAFLDFCKTYGRDLELWLEPGKYLVSESGYFLTRTNVVKKTPGITFVGVDSGLNHLIRPMFYDAYHDIYNLSNPEAPENRYDVVGYICETDTFASGRNLAEVREGDILVFKNAGAYCYSMASNYNARLRPAEVLIWKGEAKLIRHREVFEDLIRDQPTIDLD